MEPRLVALLDGDPETEAALDRSAAALRDATAPLLT
jgi:hypothetical protein